MPLTAYNLWCIIFCMWDILQTAELGEWFASGDGVDEAAREDIRAAVGVLRSVGPSLGRPLVDSVYNSRHSNMKELRVQSKGRPFRIFFLFDPKRRGILLVGGNKQGDSRFYETMIVRADDSYDQYLMDNFPKKEGAGNGRKKTKKR